MESTEKKSEKEQVWDFIKLCLKYWYYFVISGIVCLFLGILYMKYKTPVYSIVSQVALRQDDPLTGGNSGGSNGLLGMIGGNKNSDNVEDETLKMYSHDNVKGVVKALNLNVIYQELKAFGLIKTKLYDQSPISLDISEELSDTISKIVKISIGVEKNSLSTIKIKYGRKNLLKVENQSFPCTLKTSVGDFTFSKSSFFQNFEPPFKLNIIFANYDYIAQVYSSDLVVDFEKKNSDIIHLSTETENVVMGKKILMELINEYNKNWDDDKRYVYSKTIEYIDERLNYTTRELDHLDVVVEDFKKKNNIREISADVQYYLELSAEIQTKLLQAEISYSSVDVILDFINSPKNEYNLIPFTMTTSIPSLAEVISRYNELLERRNNLVRDKKLDTNTALIRSIEEQLKAQRMSLFESLNNIKKGYKINLDNTIQKNKELENILGNIPTIEKNYLEIKREQLIAQNVYNILISKREEMGLKSATFMPKLKIIDSPYIINKPVSPNLIKVGIMILFFGGLIIPLSLIYGIPYLRKNIRTRKK